MFYVEYTENDERKALNLAMCQTIETHVHETSGRNTYAIHIQHESYGKKSIEFETKEELMSTFNDLMDALKSYQAHWVSQRPLRHESSRS